jgi:hypothetical protein
MARFWQLSNLECTDTVGTQFLTDKFGEHGKVSMSPSVREEKIATWPADLGSRFCIALLLVLFST